jgi:hypothetical protein
VQDSGREYILKIVTRFTDNHKPLKEARTLVYELPLNVKNPDEQWRFDESISVACVKI